MSIPTRGIDFHCHLDLYPDFEQLVAECEAAAIMTLAVTTTPRAFLRNLKLASSCRYVRAALGLHPQLIADRSNEIALFEQYLPQTRYVGEVGLDANSRFYSSFNEQVKIFTRILNLCAEARGKILSVHSVRATTHVLRLLETYLPPEKGSVVLHWFTGTAREAQRAVDLGCYFSINGEMLRHAIHKKTVEGLPIKRLLTETDGPFVTLKGKPIRPIDVLKTVDELAVIRSISSEEMSAQLCTNLEALNAR